MVKNDNDFTKKLIKGLRSFDYNDFFSKTYLNVTPDYLIKELESKKKIIKFLKEFPDPENSFNIITKFLDELKNKKGYNKLFWSPSIFEEAKILIQNSDEIYPRVEKFLECDEAELEKNPEETKNALCNHYAFLYDQLCKTFFQEIAETIKNKKIYQCAKCIKIITKYEPKMAVFMRYFIPKIRNSIKHNDSYYDHKKKVVVFKDRNKPPLRVELRKLRFLCIKLELGDKLLSMAYFNQHINHLEKSNTVLKRIENKCVMLGRSFPLLVKEINENNMELRIVEVILDLLIKREK